MASRRKITVGDVEIGGGAPVVVQSMAMSPTHDLERLIPEIKGLEEVGCEIIRVSVPDQKSADALPAILKQVSIPLIADIHFDHRMALESIKAGAHCIRINPGNIGSFEKIKTIIDAAKKKGIAIRIGVNGGSLEKDLLEKYGYPKPEALVESAIRHVEFFEAQSFHNFKLSIKSSDVKDTIASYRLLSKEVDCPLHLGVTEAGPAYAGSIKSAIALGSLLADGIGDTIRVSLTADCKEEVKAAKAILKSLGLRQFGVDVIACPSCARAEVDVVALANRVEKATIHIKTPLKVAVMGCAVNGPGEAKGAHVGIAGGKHEGLLYIDGETAAKVPEDKLFDTLMAQIKTLEAGHQTHQ